MTVKELRDKLERFPDDAVVYVPCEKYTCIPHAVAGADSVTDYIPTETEAPDPRVMIY